MLITAKERSEVECNLVHRSCCSKKKKGKKREQKKKNKKRTHKRQFPDATKECGGYSEEFIILPSLATSTRWTRLTHNAGIYTKRIDLDLVYCASDSTYFENVRQILHPTTTPERETRPRGEGWGYGATSETHRVTRSG